MKQYFYIILLSSLGLFGCKSNLTNAYQVAGTYANHEGNFLYLEKVISPKLIVVDTLDLNEDGTFEAMGKIDEPGLFRLRDNRNRGPVFFLEGGADVQVKFDAQKPAEYSASGNNESESLTAFTRARKNYNSDSIKSLIAKEESPYVALWFINSLNPRNDRDFLIQFADRLESEIPNSSYTYAYNEVIDKLKSTVYPPAIGESLRDISLESPDGKTYTLSELKGQYVLLDFWAAWCGPCRRENPNIVEAYNKYRDKNFTVYSVSLDNTKDAWVKAIQKDNLTWPYHVSDLKKWSSTAAKQYAVGSIPANFLIDPKGNIIGINLRGPALQNRLAELLG